MRINPITAKWIFCAVFFCAGLAFGKGAVTDAVFMLILAGAGMFVLQGMETDD